MAIVFGMRIRPSSGLSATIKALDGDFDEVQAVPGSEPFRVDPTHLPKKLKWQSGDSSCPDDFDRTPWMNVSARAKDAIEQLEPNVHQFVPVEYLGKGGKHLADRYWFITGHVIDSMDRARTNMIFHLNSWHPAKYVARRYPHLLPPGTDVTAEPRLVFNLGQIGGAHLWRDRYVGGGGKGTAPFMSQAMRDHLQARGLTGIDYDAGQVEAAA